MKTTIIGLFLIIREYTLVPRTNLQQRPSPMQNRKSLIFPKINGSGWQIKTQMCLLISFTKSPCLSTWEEPGVKNRKSISSRSGGIWYKKADIHDVSVNIIDNTAILLNRITLLAVVGGNEVTNPFMVTEVYMKLNGNWKLGSSHSPG